MADSHLEPDWILLTACRIPTIKYTVQRGHGIHTSNDAIHRALTALCKVGKCMKNLAVMESAR